MDRFEKRFCEVEKIAEKNEEKIECLRKNQD